MLRFIALSAVLSIGSAAAAQNLEEGRAHFEAGRAAYDTGDYERAETEFRASYALTQHPDLSFNLYLAAERAGHLEAAQRALRTYLRDGDLSEAERTLYETRAEHLAARVASSVATPPPPDEELATPVIFVRRGRIHPAATALFVVAGAFAASFAVGAALSEARDRELAGDCGRDTAFPSCADDRVDGLRRRNLVADISAAGAVASAVVGLVLVFTLKRDGDVRASARANADGGALAIEGRF